MMRDLLIAGAMKAGTTSLYHYLANHPQIAPCVVKETHYYADDLRDHFAERVITEKDVINKREANPGAWFHHARIRSRAVYDSLFPVNERAQVRMEASPSYLPSIVAAGRIATEAVDPLVVVVLRNPYHRIISHYEMNRTTRGLRDPLEVVLNVEREQRLPLVRDGHVALTRLSMYADDVQRLIETLGRERVLIVRMEQLKGNVEHVLGKICSGLDLPYRAGILGEEKKHNRGLEPRAKWVHNVLAQSGLLQLARRAVPIAVKRRMNNFYYKERVVEPAQHERALRHVRIAINEDLERLSDLLKEDFSEWARP